MTYVPPTDLAQLVWIVHAAIAICGGFAIAALIGLCLGAVAIVLRDRAPRLIRTALPGRLARFGRCS